MIAIILKRVIFDLIVLPIFLTLLVIIFLDEKAVYRSTLLITELLPGISLPLLDGLYSSSVHQTLELEFENKIIQADLYMPSGNQDSPAFIFFLGVSPVERGSDPRVDNLVNTLAGLGIAVLVPWLETQEKEVVVKDDIESLIYLFEYLSGMDGIDNTKVGMGGICTGASMVAVAASDDRINQKVKFLNLFAGYYNAFDFMESVLTEQRFYDGRFQDWKPDSLTKKVVLRQLVESISNSQDKDYLIRLISNEGANIQNEFLITDEAKVIHLIISDPYTNDLDDLFQQLPPETISYLNGISPSSFTKGLKTNILIMHDRNDKLVPVEESRRFTDSLKSQESIYYTEFSSFQNQIQVHKDEDSKNISIVDYAREALKLLTHLYETMKQVS